MSDFIDLSQLLRPEIAIKVKNIVLNSLTYNQQHPVLRSFCKQKVVFQLFELKLCF